MSILPVPTLHSISSVSVLASRVCVADEVKPGHVVGYAAVAAPGVTHLLPLLQLLEAGPVQLRHRGVTGGLSLGGG